jgi:hypothetical protein
VGDSIGIQTTLAQSGNVSRIQQGQQVPGNADEPFAHKLREAEHPDSALLRDVRESERAAIRERERKRRQEAKRRRDQEHARSQELARQAEQRESAPQSASGHHVDVKV